MNRILSLHRVWIVTVASGICFSMPGKALGSPQPGVTLEAGQRTPGVSSVKLVFSPDYAAGEAGALFSTDVRLIAEPGESHAVVSTELILTWDPVTVELVGSTQENAGETWFITGFLDDPDGINAPPGPNELENDGDALFTALIPPGKPALIDEQGVTVTTIHFRFLASEPKEPVRVIPSLGEFGTTQILGVLPGEVLTDPELPELVFWPTTAVPTMGSWGICGILLGMITVVTLAMRQPSVIRRAETSKHSRPA